MIVTRNIYIRVTRDPHPTPPEERRPCGLCEKPLEGLFILENELRPICLPCAAKESDIHHPHLRMALPTGEWAEIIQFREV